MEAEERHQRDERQLSEALAAVRREVEEEITRQRAAQAELERTREVLGRDRPRFAEGHPPGVIERYSLMRQRHPETAVVRVVDHSCDGCRMQLVNQTLLQLNLGTRFTFCEHCGRFLVPAESGG